MRGANSNSKLYNMKKKTSPFFGTKSWWSLCIFTKTTYAINSYFILFVYITSTLNALPLMSCFHLNIFSVRSIGSKWVEHTDPAAAAAPLPVQYYTF